MCMNITKVQARERNLKIRIAAINIEGRFNLKDILSRDEIKNLFYFRESDLINSLNTFFNEKKGKGYVLKPNIVKDIEKMKQLHSESLNDFKSSKAFFVQTFAEFRNNYMNHMLADFSEKYQKLYSTLLPHLEILHWGELPEFDDQMIINRDILPESNIKEYYNHYHSLEDLFELLTGTHKSFKSFKGDINLNKKLTFKVFSRRWDHEDFYSIERRIDGWYVSHISINGLAKKDGTGSLLMNLKQDSIQFPEEGVKYAFETLWNMADETEMSVDELQNKLQEIADWISAVEKVVGANQPEWCNYY